jgi:hypothetical protein
MIHDSVLGKQIGQTREGRFSRRVRFVIERDKRLMRDKKINTGSHGCQRRDVVFATENQ